MFRKMRRFKQSLSREEIDEILKKGSSGILALHGDGGYPYAVPISYAYVGDKLYFHSAKAGHKIDAVRNNEKASFCVIGEDSVVPSEYTTYFRSVIAFGKVREITNAEDVRKAVTLIAEKYSPDFKSGIDAEIDREFNALAVIEMQIEHITGKEAIELTKQRKTTL